MYVFFLREREREYYLETVPSDTANGGVLEIGHHTLKNVTPQGGNIHRAVMLVFVAGTEPNAF